VASVLLAGRIPGIESTAARAAQPMGERLRLAADRAVPMVSELASDRSLRGEIDWIFAKACARELHDRYANAGALADDLARLREGQPITAAPRDSGYAGLFAVRKYRVQIGAVAVSLVAIVGSLAYVARLETARAQQESERNERLSALLETARVELVPLTGATRGDIVDEQKALPVLEMLHAINLELLGPAAEETQRSALNLGRAYDRVGRHAEAERIYRSMLDIALGNAQRLGDQAFLRFMIAGAIRRSGPERLVEARRLLDTAIAYWDSLADPPFLACSGLLEKAFVAVAEGKYDEQGQLLEQAVACSEREAGPGHIRRREAYGFMADHHRERGDFEAARAWYGKALDGFAGASSAIEVVWRDAWMGEILWMEREAARRAGEPFDPAREVEFQSIVETVRSRDAGNKRLERWSQGPSA